MKVGEYSASRRTALPALVFATLLAGCDDAPLDAPREGASNATLSPPSFVAESRIVDPAGLTPQLTVNGMVTNPQLFRGEWTTSFRLPDTAENSLVVTWTYTPPRGGEGIVVARYGPVNVNNALETRNIRILDSDYVRPNDDGDSFDNLQEIERGTDPNVRDDEAFAPRADQGDCRETRFPGMQIDDEQDAPRDEIGLSIDPVSVSRAVELPAGRQVYFATFLLEVPGTLTIEHQAGLPTNTEAALYDRRAGTPADMGTANVLFEDEPNRERARIAAELVEPGLYCYILYDETAGEFGAGEPLSGLVLGIAFTPAAGAGS